MRAYYSSLGKTIHLQASADDLTVTDKVQLAQDVLRDLVLPQCYKNVEGDEDNPPALTDPKLDAALQTVWTALNNVLPKRR